MDTGARSLMAVEVEEELNASCTVKTKGARAAEKWAPPMMSNFLRRAAVWDRIPSMLNCLPTRMGLSKLGD